MVSLAILNFHRRVPASECRNQFEKLLLVEEETKEPATFPGRATTVSSNLTTNIVRWWSHFTDVQLIP